MIQYIREFALKNTLQNTVSVRLGLGSFLHYLGIGIGVWGLQLALV